MFGSFYSRRSLLLTLTKARIVYWLEDILRANEKHYYLFDCHHDSRLMRNVDVASADEFYITDNDTIAVYFKSAGRCIC